MQENSQETFFLIRENLSLYYKALVIKLYDVEIRRDKWIHIKEKKTKLLVILYIYYVLYIKEAFELV